MILYSESEPHASMSTTSRSTASLYLQKLCYRPEYKKTYCCVKYDEQPGIKCMFYSVCEKWAEISKGFVCTICG